jgi:hypothetical protein
MAGPQECKKLVSLLVEHQDCFSAMSDDDYRWAIQLPENAIAIFIDAVKNRPKVTKKFQTWWTFVINGKPTETVVLAPIDFGYEQQQHRPPVTELLNPRRLTEWSEQNAERLPKNRAIKLFPVEAVPQIREQYRNQPKGSILRVATAWSISDGLLETHTLTHSGVDDTPPSVVVDKVLHSTEVLLHDKYLYMLYEVNAQDSVSGN